MQYRPVSSTEVSHLRTSALNELSGLLLVRCWKHNLNNWYHVYVYLLHLLGDIPMFYIKYIIMHKVQMQAGAIRQLLYVCAYVREIIHSLKLVDYLPCIRTNHTIIYCFNCLTSNISIIFFSADTFLCGHR